jgi:hypothetical protein
MVNYLCRYEILWPSIEAPGRRGARRWFSFSDLVFARGIAKLLHAGASVKALRRALNTLRRKLNGLPPSTLLGQHVVIVGQSVYLSESGTTPVELTANGQLAFHFVLDAPLRPAADRSRRIQSLVGKRA